MLGLVAAIGNPAGAGEKPRAASTLYVAPLEGPSEASGRLHDCEVHNINAAIKAAAVG